MRKYLREIARFRMKRAGLQQINKKRAGGKSLFAQHWREYIGDRGLIRAAQQRQRRSARAQGART